MKKKLDHFKCDKKVDLNRNENFQNFTIAVGPADAHFKVSFWLFCKQPNR